MSEANKQSISTANALDAFLDAAFAAKGLGTWHWTQIVTETAGSDKRVPHRKRVLEYKVRFACPKDQFTYELLGGEQWYENLVDQWVKQRAFKHDYT